MSPVEDCIQIGAGIGMADQMTRFHQEMADRATVVRKGKSKGPLGAEVANAHKVAKAMLAEGDNLLNRDVLLKYMRAFGLVNNGWPGFNHLQSWCNSSKVGLLQIPTEFAACMTSLPENI